MNMSREDDVGLVPLNPLRQLDIAIKFLAVPARRRAVGWRMIDPNPGLFRLGAVASQLLFDGLFCTGAVPPGTNRDEYVVQRHTVSVRRYAHQLYPAHPSRDFFAVGVA